MAAPRGRPPAGYRCVDGVFKHTETGDPYDVAVHAALVHAKKIACMKSHYWERGGRAARLKRYVRTRQPKATQLTLPDGEPYTTSCGVEAVELWSNLPPVPEQAPVNHRF